MTFLYLEIVDSIHKQVRGCLQNLYQSGQKLISVCRYRVIESSSLVPVLFREVFSHPYISLFHLLVNGFSVLIIIIREYGSTLYVGLARAVSPTNTNFRLTFLLTRLQEALYEDLAV